MISLMIRSSTVDSVMITTSCGYEQQQSIYTLRRYAFTSYVAYHICGTDFSQLKASMKLPAMARLGSKFSTFAGRGGHTHTHMYTRMVHHMEAGMLPSPHRHHMEAGTLPHMEAGMLPSPDRHHMEAGMLPSPRSNVSLSSTPIDTPFRNTHTHLVRQPPRHNHHLSRLQLELIR